MADTAFDAMGILRAGGGLEVDGAAYSTFDLQGMARAAGDSGAILVIYNAGAKSTFDKQGLAHMGKGKVVFRD